MSDGDEVPQLLLEVNVVDSDSDNEIDLGNVPANVFILENPINETPLDIGKLKVTYVSRIHLIAF